MKEVKDCGESASELMIVKKYKNCTQDYLAWVFVHFIF